MESLAKFFKHKHNFKNGFFRLFDKNRNQIYFEDLNGYWAKKEFDENNNEIYYENSDGYWGKSEYDENNNIIYFEGSNGFWSKSEYDGDSNEIYCEDSSGRIEDNRPTCAGKIVEIDGKKYKLKEI